MAKDLDGEMAGQFRRAALSVSLNIAEGTGRFDRDQRRFLITARLDADENDRLTLTLTLTPED